MIKKIRKSLDKAPTKNYFCLLDTSLDEDHYENDDNKFICSTSILIKERRHMLNKKTPYPGSTTPPNTVYQSDWNGCVSYIPTVDGYLINVSMVKGYEGNSFEGPLLSAFNLVRDWMIKYNEDIAMSKSLFTSLGDNHSDVIERLLYQVFNDKSCPTVYITKPV